MRQAREKLELWQDSGRLRQDVPFPELNHALETHINQLRITGTPAEKTVALAFERLAESEYAMDGSSLGQTVGLVGDKLAIGSVAVKLRKRS